MSTLAEGGCECPQCQGEEVSYRAPPCRLEHLKPLSDLNTHIGTHEALESSTDWLHAPYALYEVHEIITAARNTAKYKRKETQEQRETQRELLARYSGTVK